MSGLRYDHILASTALALVLATPLGAFAQAPAGKDEAAGKVAAAPAGEAAPAAAPSEATAAAPKDTPAAATPPTANPEPAAAPDPLASLDPADRPIAEKIRDLFAAKSDRTLDKIFASKKERAAVEAFYQARNLAPLWLDKGVENARATAAIAHLNAAEAEGLEPRDYKVPSFAGLAPEALAEAELKLTAVVLTYARHLQAGRFPYNRVASNNIELPQAPPDPAEVLTKLAAAADAGKALAEYSPPQEEYKKLKGVLAELRAKAGGGSKQLAEGVPLKLVAKTPMEDPRVPLLREKLGLGGDAADLKYDTKLAEAVKKFQKANDLPVTGVLDARTIKELNGPPRDRQIDLIIGNMERWRWYPRDLGKAHVIVNHEYLPALQQDPTVLERMGLKVVYNRDGSVHIYQPPGEANALGRIRFNFPNRFLVYQHDTPEKYMF